MIRSASPDDAAEIAALLTDLGYPAEPQAIRDRLATMTSGDKVLLTDGGLVAIHLIPRIAEDTPLARITALVVSPKRRRSGVGKALLAAAEATAWGWGATRLEVSSGLRPERVAAHAFYRGAGFEDTGSRSVLYGKAVGDG